MIIITLGLYTAPLSTSTHSQLLFQMLLRPLPRTPPPFRGTPTLPLTRRCSMGSLLHMALPLQLLHFLPTTRSTYPACRAKRYTTIVSAQRPKRGAARSVETQHSRQVCAVITKHGAKPCSSTAPTMNLYTSGTRSRWPLRV